MGGRLPTTVDAAAAPGENIRASAAEPERAVFEMLNAARRSEGLPALESDPALDQLAQDHAAAMRSRGRLEHDLGDGNPIPAAPGEWRTRYDCRRKPRPSSSTPACAHCAICASPRLHRANLLSPSFRQGRNPRRARRERRVAGVRIVGPRPLTKELACAILGRTAVARPVCQDPWWTRTALQGGKEFGLRKTARRIRARLFSRAMI